MSASGQKRAFAQRAGWGSCNPALRLGMFIGGRVEGSRWPLGDAMHLLPVKWGRRCRLRSRRFMVTFPAPRSSRR